MKKFHLIRTDQFDQSLRDLIAHIKEDSPANASAFLEGVFSAVDEIAIFPEKAVKIAPDVRVKFFKGYWIPYRIGDRSIYILDILHPRQDTKARQYRGA